MGMATGHSYDLKPETDPFNKLNIDDTNRVALLAAIHSLSEIIKQNAVALEEIRRIASALNEPAPKPDKIAPLSDTSKAFAESLETFIDSVWQLYRSHYGKDGGVYNDSVSTTIHKIYRELKSRREGWIKELHDADVQDCDCFSCEQRNACHACDDAPGYCEVCG